MSVKAGSRDITLDVARGIAIVLLVYAHALEMLFNSRPDGAFDMTAFVQWQFICTFDVPLFFLISGASHRNIARKSFREVAESSLKLLAMTFIVHIIGAIALYFQPVGALRGGELLWVSFTSIIKGDQFTTVVIWFLYALAVIQFLFYLLVRIKDLPAAWQRVAAYAAFAIGFAAAATTLLEPDLNNYLQVKAWVPGLVFFGIGYWLKRRNWTAPPVWTALPLFAAVALLAPLNLGCAFSLTESCPTPQLSGRFAVLLVDGSLGNWPLFLLTALTGCAAMLALSQAKILAPFAWMGRNSLELFLVNGFVLVYVNASLNTVPVGQLGLGFGGYDVVALMTVGQIALVALLQPIFGAYRTATAWLAARAVSILAWMFGWTRAVFAGAR